MSALLDRYDSTHTTVLVENPQLKRCLRKIKAKRSARSLVESPKEAGRMRSADLNHL
jgi:hypothetical protein